jgi:hypothetical protein
MAQLCSKCSRANPVEAVYCWFDGFVLPNQQRRGGPVAVGAQLFKSPFVFPTGRTCRTFDELALACQEDWKAACGLLKDGYLESFLGGLDRVDLALAAKEAARFPDPERGLDQLLATLPSSVLTDPKLRVEPLEVNLGLLEGNEPRNFTLELENQGMRLLYGTAISDSVWLTLGSGTGANEKHFHFTHDVKIPTHIRPDLVRAGNKPIEGRITFESNGGSLTVTVRAQKPVKPFPAGPLGGAKTPRQVAEKAQANPKEVAPLFDSGEVSRWYASNGWTYPVKTPAASGPAAIQQFFEALGVTKPPKVDISHREFHLKGKPGDKVPLTFEVSSQEKRPVFAHVTSSVPWLEVSKARFNGRTATINMSVPTVPNKPGATLTGELTVLSNGNQRFRVPVRLDVLGSQFDFSMPDIDRSSRHEEPPPPPPPPPPPFVDMEAVKEAKPAEKKAPPPPISTPRRRPTGAPVWAHAVPAGLLGLAVLAVVVFDLLDQKKPDVDPGTRGGITGPNYDPRQLRSPKPRLGVQFTPENRFGVVMLDAQDPKNKGSWKRLTFSTDGATNNTIVKIGGNEYKFGFTTRSNVWRPKVPPYRRELKEPYKGWISTMDFTDEQVRVTQYLQIVPGQTMLLDTLLIYYRIRNYGTVPQKVAVRVLLDTYIGDNDGVPFTAPGTEGFVTTKAEYKDSAIPDYLEVVENGDNPTNPGTVVRVGLHGLQWSDKVPLLAPERIRICRFPGSETRWDWEMDDMTKPGEDLGKGDSCVAVYWPEEEIEPKQTRYLAMTYGLGKLDVNDQLALSAPAAVIPGREFVVTAYVYNATKGQKVKLELPSGATLTSGSAEITIPEAAKRTQVFWKVRANKEGNLTFEAVSGRARARPVQVKVQAKSIFG